MGKERHSNRFTQAQKDAILKHVLIDGHTPAQAWRAAKAGQLGIPAFDPGQRHIYTLIKRGRESFEHEHSEALANTTHAALIRLHRLALNRALALNEDTDVAEIAKTAKTLAETERALNASQPKTPVETNPTPDNNTANQAASVVTSLLDKTRPTKPESARTGSFSRSLNGGQQGGDVPAA